MFYYVYMLKSISSGVKKTYVGYTNNLDLRLNKHNS
ncbi:GIY-YIG nuclease family protein, partial [Candidatus Pelagibacter sp.]|nr:GIY-YIG nuclease family protein [Candidatus Pelagibacter sp.]